MSLKLISPESEPTMDRMDTQNLIKARAHRILRRLPHYLAIDEASSDEKTELEEFELQDGEAILGIYENIPHQLRERVVISTRGLYLFKDEAWQHITYASMSEVKPTAPDKEGKMNASMLAIKLKTGEEIEIPVKGGTDRTRDIWSFIQFLDRVIEDIKD